MRAPILIFLLAAMGGCQRSDPGSGGIWLGSEADVSPTAPTDEKVQLNLGGSRMAAEAKSSQTGSTFQVELRMYGEVIDTERYSTADSAFSLIEAGSERCEPPLPLLKFPMNIGDTWEWKGRLFTGSVIHEATGKVVTGTEKLTVHGSPTDTIHCDVELHVESGGPKPAVKRLQFWFGKGKGLLRREFGFAGIREPLEGP